MITIRDYAQQKSISYEAARKSVKTHSEELEGHIFKKGKTQFLDEEAVQILDSFRATNPIVVIREDKNAEVERLKAENEALKAQLLNVQQRLIDEQKAHIEDIKLLQAAPAPASEPEKKKGFFARIFG